MAGLSIRVLGPLEVSLQGEPVASFASDKVRALLAYLALSPDRPHRREALAGLLWPEFPERSARTNLRNALANLRRVTSDSTASPPFLHCTRQTIQFNGQSDYWLDALAFEALVAPLPVTIEPLEQAVSLVQGTFLEGFTLSDAAPFEEWLLLRREHLGRHLVEALDSLAAICEAGGAYEEAIIHARRRVELEPWQEEGQQRLMRLLALMSQRSEALAQYEKLRRSLQAEVGAEPSAETRALLEAILAGELGPESTLGPGPSLPTWNLPALPTPFFGRADELAALEARLAEPDTRLVTLTGLGGCGKTRLALEFGSRLVDRERRALADKSPLTFEHGIVFVPLAALDSAEGVGPALADALQLRLEWGQEQLLAFLRRKQLLFILDNLEQLLPGLEFLAQVLRAAPGVKILATSRERLQMQGEHALHLGGLPFPAHDPRYAGPEVVDLDACLADYPALQLLAEGIRRVRPGFSLSAQDLPTMLEICGLVDGLPLALELAASWADALSLEDILVEAQRSLDFWQVDWPDLPERQRSLRAVFDASWRRLGPSEQAAFSSLTVFRGGFARDAARQVVVGAETNNPRLLAALVRNSFLYYDEYKDRYGIHELLRQFGAEMLAREPARKAEVRDRHSIYYSSALKRWWSDMIGSRQQAALSEMEIESENIRTAWYWAVEQALIERLDEAIAGLERFYWHSGRYRQAEAAFRAAASAAGKAAGENFDQATCLRIQVRALTQQSSYQRALAQRDEARLVQKRCLAILNNPALAGVDTRLERGILIFTMGLTDCMMDYEQGRKRYEEAYFLYRDLDFKWGMSGALNAWGTMSTFLGDHRDAELRLEEALAIQREIDDLSGAARSLRRLALIAWLRGRFEEAELLAWEGFAASMESGNKSESAMSHLNLGQVLDKVAKYSEAHSFLQQGLVLLGELGHHNYITQAHCFLGSSDMHMGHYEEARDHAATGLALARKHGPPYSVGLSLILLGCLDLAGGAHARAHQHLQDGIAVFRDSGQRVDLSWALTCLAIASRELGDTREASQHLYEALKLAVDLGAVPPTLVGAAGNGSAAFR